MRSLYTLAVQLHPTLRKSIKYLGTGFCLLLITSWTGSLWGNFRWTSQSRWWIGVIPAALDVGHSSGSDLSRSPPGWRGGFIGERGPMFLHLEYVTERGFWALGFFSSASGKEIHTQGTRFW